MFQPTSSGRKIDFEGLRGAGDIFDSPRGVEPEVAKILVVFCSG